MSFASKHTYTFVISHRFDYSRIDTNSSFKIYSYYDCTKI